MGVLILIGMIAAAVCAKYVILIYYILNQSSLNFPINRILLT